MSATFKVAVSSLALALTLAACNGESASGLLASGKAYLEKNDPKAAIIQFKNALQKEPSLAEARYLLGSALFESGDVALAEIELRKALELKHAPDITIPLLARVLLAAGQEKKLTDEFARTQLGNPEAQAALSTSLSTAYANLGKQDLAQQKLAEALAAQPDYLPAVLVDIRKSAASKDVAGAKAKVEALLSKHPANPEALLIRGNIAAIEGDGALALSQYLKAIEAKENFVAAHAAAISQLLATGKMEEAERQLDALKRVAPKNPGVFYFQSQISYLRKDFKAAREYAQQLLKIAPNNPVGLQLAGVVELQFRSYLQAETYLAKALQLAPNLVLARRMLVASHLRSGQPGKALETLQPVLGGDKVEPALLSLAGEVYLQNGNPNKAAEYFARASKGDPGNVSRQTSLAIAHLAQGNLSGGLQELEQISLSDSGTSADLALVAAYLQIKQFDKALKAIDSLEKKQPDNPGTHNLRARALLVKKDIPGARKSFEKALVLNPTFFPAVSALANLDLLEKKPEEARKRFETVLASDPKHMQALLALAELKARSGGKPEEVSTLIRKAVDANPAEAAPRVALVRYHLGNKDTKAALSTASEASAAIPDSPEIIELLGAVQQMTGDLNQATLTFNKLAALQPASPLPLLRLADVQLANKNREDGVKNLKKSLALKPDLIEAQTALARISLENKDTAGALDIARTVQKQRPKEAAGYLLEATVHRTNTAWGEAVAALKQGLKQAPTAELAVRLNGALLAAGNRTEAEKAAVSWLKENPKDVVFRMHLGDQEIANKNWKHAAAHYESALAIQPENALILNNLAWISGQLKSPKALEYAEKANKISPNQPAMMDTWAMLLAEKGQTDKALDLLRQARAAAPQSTAIQLNLARVLILAGQKDEARKELEALVKLGDKVAEQAEVEQLLKSL